MLLPLLLLLLLLPKLPGAMGSSRRLLFRCPCPRDCGEFMRVRLFCC